MSLSQDTALIKPMEAVAQVYSSLIVSAHICPYPLIATFGLLVFLLHVMRVATSSPQNVIYSNCIYNRTHTLSPEEVLTMD